MHKWLLGFMGKWFHKHYKDFAAFDGHHFSSNKQLVHVIGILPCSMVATLQVTNNQWIFIFHCRQCFRHIKATNTKEQLQQAHHPM
jgi:hypothetical protein